jgi:hypothetical protein
MALSLLTMIFEPSAAHATLTSPPPLPTNSPPAPRCACSWGTPLIIKATGALTSPPTGSLYLAMLFSMKQHSLSAFAGPHLLPTNLISSLMMTLCQLFSHPLQVLYQGHPLLASWRLDHWAPPCLCRPRRPLLRRPCRRPLHHSRCP